MDMLHDAAHTGIFEPQDVVILQKAFACINATDPRARDEESARSLARSIIALYRQGVRDPQEIADSLHAGRN